MTASEAPDEVLVLGAILGNLEAFEQLVLRYRPAVVRLARSIVGTDDSEDVAQDALLLAFKALPGIEEPRRFAASTMDVGEVSQRRDRAAGGIVPADGKRRVDAMD